MEIRGEERANYIVHAKHKGEQIIRVPSSEETIEKTVQDYELDINEIRNRLDAPSVEQCGDHTVSDNMARHICHEFRLLDVR